MDSCKLISGRLLRLSDYSIVNPTEREEEINTEYERLVRVIYEISFGKVINGSYVIVLTEEYKTESERNEDYEKIEKIWMRDTR